MKTLHSDTCSRSLRIARTRRFRTPRCEGGVQNCPDTSVQKKGWIRRSALAVVPLLSCFGAQTVLPALADIAISPVNIVPELAPDQSKYDPTDPELRAAAQLLQDALGAPNVETEEALWTEIIQKYGNGDANWVPDLVGRAYGNRGNARSRQGKLDDALADFNKAIEICPWSVDPVLNRGVVLEAQGRWEEAIRDYRAILDVNPKDPAGWNNLGNSYAGLGQWEEAAEYYGKAVALAPEFAFAFANRTVALYQMGREKEAIRNMRTLLRKYPEFPDMRAALTAALWGQGEEAEAEEQWDRVEDVRYKDKTWLVKQRRWPPKLVKNLTAFLEVKSV